MLYEPVVRLQARPFQGRTNSKGETSQEGLKLCRIGIAIAKASLAAGIFQDNHDWSATAIVN